MRTAQNEEVRPRVEATAGSIRLRGLPEGRSQLDLVLDHPFFLPGTARPAADDAHLDLARGTERELALSVAAIGGAITLDGAPAARITDPSGASRVMAADPRGRVLAAHLPEGDYRVDACGDAVCTTIRRSWPGVPVRRAAFTALATD